MKHELKSIYDILFRCMEPPLDMDGEEIVGYMSFRPKSAEKANGRLDTSYVPTGYHYDPEFEANRFDLFRPVHTQGGIELDDDVITQKSRKSSLTGKSYMTGKWGRSTAHEEEPSMTELKSPAEQEASPAEEVLSLARESVQLTEPDSGLEVNEPEPIVEQKKCEKGSVKSLKSILKSDAGTKSEKSYGFEVEFDESSVDSY